jgi:hypothetical protein
VVGVHHVPVFELFILDWYCSEDVKMSHHFILRLAISREVAWLTTVVTVVVLFLVAVALSITKLFL